MPAVSVIVPVYNGEKYLRECLDSIRGQTFSDMEIIVIDDGSSDSSVNITNDFCERDSRFRLIKVTHGGVSKARNTGIENARGEFLSFVDADDCLWPEAIEKLFIAASEEEADVVIGSFFSAKKFPRALKAADDRKEIYDYRKAMKKALYQSRLMNSPGGTLVKNKLIGENNRFREGIRYEDLDAFYRFYERARKIVFLPAALYFYRKNSSSFINNWSESRLDALDVTDRLFEFFKTKYPELTKAASDRRFSAHFNALMLMLKCGVNDKKTEMRCMKVVREGRLRAILDPNVRLKNKLGALLSLGGMPVLRLFTKFR